MENYLVSWLALVVLDLVCLLVIVTSILYFLFRIRSRSIYKNNKIELVSWGLLFLIMLPITLNNYSSFTRGETISFIHYGTQLISSVFMLIYLTLKKADFI